MSTDPPKKKPMRVVIRNNKIIPLTKSLVKRIKNLRPQLFVETKDDDTNLYDNNIDVKNNKKKNKKKNDDNDSTSSNEDELNKSSPNTLNMSKIILDNQKLKEKQQKIEHNIDNRLVELDNEIKEYKIKIKKLEEKRRKYERMKDNYADSKFDFCLIL